MELKDSQRQLTIGSYVSVRPLCSQRFWRARKMRKLLRIFCALQTSRVLHIYLYKRLREDV